MAIKDAYSARCGKCNNLERLSVIASHEENIPDFAGYDEYDEEQLGYGALSIYLLIGHCPRCKHINLLKVPFDNSTGEEMGKPIILWPSTSRLLVEDTYLLPEKLKRLVNEFFQAEGHELYSCAAMSLRAIAEALVEQLNGGHHANFTTGLKTAEAAGRLTAQECANLSKAYDMGSAVSHRSHAITSSEVDNVWTIIYSVLDLRLWEPERRRRKEREHALKADCAAEEVAKKTPPRPKIKH